MKNQTFRLISKIDLDKFKKIDADFILIVKIFKKYKSLLKTNLKKLDRLLNNKKIEKIFKQGSSIEIESWILVKNFLSFKNNYQKADKFKNNENKKRLIYAIKFYLEFIKKKKIKSSNVDLISVRKLLRKIFLIKLNNYKNYKPIKNNPLNILRISGHCIVTNMCEAEYRGPKKGPESGGQNVVEYNQSVEMGKLKINGKKIDACVFFRSYEFKPKDAKAYPQFSSFLKYYTPKKIVYLGGRKNIKAIGIFDTINGLKFLPKEEFFTTGACASVAKGIFEYYKTKHISPSVIIGDYSGEGWATATKIRNLFRISKKLNLPMYLYTHSCGMKKLEDRLLTISSDLEKAHGSEIKGISLRIPERVIEERMAIDDLKSYGGKIIALSSIDQKYWKNVYNIPAKNITYLANGLDVKMWLCLMGLKDYKKPYYNWQPKKVKKYRSLTRNRLKKLNGQAVVSDDILILIPSRLDPRKGQENLIAHIKTICKELEKYHFSFLMPGLAEKNEYSRKLIQAIPKNFTHRFVPDKLYQFDDMIRAFSASDVVMIPSTEFSSLAAKEAMFLSAYIGEKNIGSPLLASIHSGSYDEIKNGQNGFLCNHENPKSINRSLKQIFTLRQKSPQKIYQICKKSHLEVMQKYTIEKNTKDLIRIVT